MFTCLWRSRTNRSLLLSLIVTPLSPVLAEHLGGNVLPTEQHVAADLPRVLHPDPHVEALTEQQRTERHRRSGTDGAAPPMQRYISFTMNKTITFQVLPFLRPDSVISSIYQFNGGPMINTLPVDAKRVLNALKGAQLCCKCLFLQRDRRPWLPNTAAGMIFSCLQGVVLVATFMAPGRPWRNSSFVL